jgi:hypothetical protein
MCEPAGWPGCPSPESITCGPAASSYPWSARGCLAGSRTSYAKTERHKSFETIDVSFGERPHPESAEPRS